MCRPGFATSVSFLSLPASNVHMGNEVMPKPQPSGLQCWHRRTTNQSKQLRISKKAEELKGIDMTEWYHFEFLKHLETSFIGWISCGAVCSLCHYLFGNDLIMIWLMFFFSKRVGKSQVPSVSGIILHLPRRNDWIESRGQRQAPQAPQAPTSRESTKGRGYSYIS